MRGFTALLVATLLGVCSCGGTGARQTTRSSAHGSTTSPARDASASGNPSESPLAHIAPDRDRDNDIEAPADDTRNTSVTSLGHAASPAQHRAIAALIKRYYAAALAEDGAAGCAMLYSTLAESIVEDYSGKPGVPYMEGAKSCAQAMTLLYKHYHPLLVLEEPKLRVGAVHLEERHALAQLSFGDKLSERQLPVWLERHTWRISAPLDAALP